MRTLFQSLGILCALIGCSCNSQHPNSKLKKSNQDLVLPIGKWQEVGVINYDGSDTSMLGLKIKAYDRYEILEDTVKSFISRSFVAAYPIIRHPFGAYIGIHYWKVLSLNGDTLKIMHHFSPDSIPLPYDRISTLIRVKEFTY